MCATEIIAVLKERGHVQGMRRWLLSAAELRNAAADAPTPLRMVYTLTDLKPSWTGNIRAKRPRLRGSLSLPTTQLTTKLIIYLLCLAPRVGDVWGLQAQTPWRAQMGAGDG